VVPSLKVCGLLKAFSGTVAVDRVDFSVQPGEIHSLIGSNGAGKSTLIKVLAGLERAEEGQVFVQGVEYSGHHLGSRGLPGLAFIHQDLALIDRLTVAENLLIGRPPSFMGVIKKRQMEQLTTEVLGRYLPGVKPWDPLLSLSVAQRWMLSIARMVLADAHTIFLDEPTAALGRNEVEMLFRAIRTVVSQGRSVVFVSHRLDEVLELSHSISVMASGRIVKKFSRSEATREQLVMAMTGGLGTSMLSGSETAHEILTRKTMVSMKNVSNESLTNVSFDLYEGEVIGIAGLVGSGRSELLETIFGVRRIAKGSLSVAGKVLNLKSPSDAVKAGIAMLPEDRKAMALFLNRSIAKNISLVYLRKLFVKRICIVDKDAEKSVTRSVFERLSVKATGPDQIVRQLSGGNQQKVVVGRWICGRPVVLMADEPTKGVDVKAKIEMLNQFREIARTGKSVILVSSDFSELVLACDRILIMRNGQLIRELTVPLDERAVHEACFVQAN